MFRRSSQKIWMPLVFVCGLSSILFAQNTEEHPVKHITDSIAQSEPIKDTEEKAGPGFNAGEMIMEHISDSHEWHFFSVKRSDGTEWHASICLPVIIYTPGAGLS